VRRPQPAQTGTILKTRNQRKATQGRVAQPLSVQIIENLIWVTSVWESGMCSLLSTFPYPWEASVSHENEFIGQKDFGILDWPTWGVVE